LATRSSPQTLEWSVQIARGNCEEGSGVVVISVTARHRGRVGVTRDRGHPRCDAGATIGRHEFIGPASLVRSGTVAEGSFGAEVTGHHAKELTSEDNPR